MIEFPCHCGNRFSVPTELAGGSIQCPQCGRLNDVPLLSELDNIDEAGVYKLDAQPSQHPYPDSVAKMTRVFTRQHFDENGEAIDLRGPVERAPEVILNAIPPAESSIPDISSGPKYDPATGELIREVEIKPIPGPDPETLPVARMLHPAALKNFDGIDVPSALEFMTIPFRLLMPGNLIVMFFILLFHMLGQAMLVAICFRYYILAPFWMVLHGLIIAHYANVIDETGPQSRQDLPTPLRHLGWHEDTWGPFSQVMLAVAVCFAPALLLLESEGRLPPQAVLALIAAMGLLGLLLFPAALLATTTSGTILNTRPDRLVGTAFICGLEYFLALGTFVAGAMLWLLGMNDLGRIALATSGEGPAVPQYLTWYFAFGILAAGTYLLHLFCWHLGVLYRKHHEEFPWVMQRHRRKSEEQAKGFPVSQVRRPAQAAQQVIPEARIARNTSPAGKTPTHG